MTGRKGLAGILDEPIGKLGIGARVRTDVSVKKIERRIHNYICSLGLSAYI